VPRKNEKKQRRDGVLRTNWNYSNWARLFHSVLEGRGEVHERHVEPLQFEIKMGGVTRACAASARLVRYDNVNTGPMDHREKNYAGGGEECRRNPLDAVKSASRRVKEKHNARIFISSARKRAVDRVSGKRTRELEGRRKKIALLNKRSQKLEGLERIRNGVQQDRGEGKVRDLNKRNVVTTRSSGEKSPENVRENRAGERRELSPRNRRSPNLKN